VASMSGVGTATIKGSAIIPATFATAGLGTLLAVNNSLSQGVASFSGNGFFSAVGYTFVNDGEIACVHEELRALLVDEEVRDAVVPAAVRAYEVGDEERDPGTENRKREC